MKIITFFNHKGGVAKTTNAFNLAWKLATRGSRVLMVDADSQCNLTGISMGLLPINPDRGEQTDGHSTEDDHKEEESFAVAQAAAEGFWSKAEEENIYTALRPVFKGEPRPLEAAKCQEFADNPNLFLLPGSIDLASYESELGVAQSLLGTFGSQANMPGAIYALISRTAQKYDADYVIVDVSPSLGAINQNVVCISDLVIIPCSPDYFSVMALRSLAKILPEWMGWAKEAATRKQLAEATYPFPAPKFKLGGIVISRYVIYRGQPARAFQQWIDNVIEECASILVPALQTAGALLTTEAYSAPGEPDFVLARIREFNSLRPKSQLHRVPPFALTQEQLALQGTSLDNTLEQVRELDVVYDRFAERVESLTQP